MIEEQAVFLHFGGASTASMLVVVVSIFFLLLALSFAFGSIPEGKRRFSRQWASTWFKASLPRLTVSALFSGALFTASALSGGGARSDAICGQGLPSLTAEPITHPRLQSAIEGMRDLRDAAERGDLATARVLIFSDAHNVTHDIDGPLRRQDSQLARRLCESLISLETEVARGSDHRAIIREAESTIELLEQAARALELPLSAEPDGSGPCDRTLSSVTELPLTGVRMTRAIEDMHRVADAAASGDTGLASEIFFGDAHNITHDIDGPLREVDRDLAVSLCRKILAIEMQLAGQADLATVADAAEAAADLMVDAGRALGLLK
jgi:hypothetical protein